MPRRWVATLAALVALAGCSSTEWSPPAAPAEPSTTTAPSTTAATPGPTVPPTGSPTASPTARPEAAPAPPRHFGTVRPGSALPSGERCAAWVRAIPIAENKGVNRAYNRVTGQAVDPGQFSGDAPAAASRIAPRIDGRFTGTTEQILRWVACKWGLDEDIVKAQAAIESWWRMDAKGDYGPDASACPPGHGLGADGRAGQCPQSYGILQDRYPYMRPAWPKAEQSTAMNADLAYGIWRACFDGYETWLNTVERGRQYAAGDAWGCVGRWFSGRWHIAAGDEYVTRVRDYLDRRIWQTPDFQQP